MKMFPKISFWGSRKQPKRTSSRRNRPMRVEALEMRRVLAVLTPVAPLVSAGFVNGPGYSDLYITSTSPEAAILVEETGSAITVTGLPLNYYGSDGNLDQAQTDINNTGVTAVTLTPPNALRDLKIKLAGVDSQVQVSDATNPVTVGRDLIISLPAIDGSTSTQLAYDSIATTTHLNVVVDDVTVARNLTITTGSLTTYEPAVITVADGSVLGSTSLKTNSSITTYGAVDNMIGLAGIVVNGNFSISTNSTVKTSSLGGDNFIAVVGTTVTGRLTISAGAGDNSVLVTDDFNETQDSSIQTFVTTHPVFGDGVDDEIVDACVVTLADDLNAASSAGYSLDAQNLNIYVLNGDNIIDVHDAYLSGGNLVISAGNGTNVIAVTETIVDATTSGSIGNATITVGSGDNLIIFVSFEVSGGLVVTTGTGSDVIVASPNVGTVVDAAIVDFVADHPGVFFDPTGTDTGGVLDINNLTQEIIDISDTDGFEVYKATITTKDLATSSSIIDLEESDIVTTLTITMGNGTDGLFLSEVGVGTVSDGTGATGGNATIKVGSGADTIVIVGVGTLGTEAVSGSAPDGEMNTFTLTTANSSNDDTVVVSLDWLGDPGYAGPAYGINAAVEGYFAVNTAYATSLAAALGGQLDIEAEYMLSNGTQESLDASHVYLTVGTASGTSANLLTLSDITISPATPEAEATNRLNVTLGGASNYLYFYDNVFDGAFADLNGGKGSSTLDEYRGGNEGSNLTVINFATVVPDETF